MPAGLDAENFFRVLLVGDADVDVLHQAAHHLAAPFRVDQSFLRKFKSQLTVSPSFFAARAPSSEACAAAIGKRGRDAGEVEPVGALEDRLPSSGRRD